MLRVAFIGWRGMVGSVLLDRMREENDFKGYEATFFTTSNVGGEGPDVGLEIPSLQDAYDIDALTSYDILLTCQGGDYTKAVYPEIRNRGWDGYWIDSASTLRLAEDSIIVLDPVNRSAIDSGISSGTVKTFVGGNCTVSLMLMGLAGLFQAGHVEWISSMTYQAASGAGAKNMIELITQMSRLGEAAKDLLADPASTAIEIDTAITAELRSSSFPKENFGAPLAASLIPWIDSFMESGQTKEEWKGYVESNKILGLEKPIPVDGLCVRVGAMRCHSQGFTIKLNRNIPMDEITDIIRESNEWVRVIPNEKGATLKDLTPAAVSGTLQIPVGRLHKMLLGDDYLAAFTCGDQLLWGAAEPVRRILNIVLEHLSS
jgi:aspartate-semialdehyde dehydrogenase